MTASKEWRNNAVELVIGEQLSHMHTVDEQLARDVRQECEEFMSTLAAQEDMRWNKGLFLSNVLHGLQGIRQRHIEDYLISHLES